MSQVMDLGLLHTFVTVARTGSVNLAARELHLSQASVSRHVQRLEAAIGSELFLRRDGRPLVLTASGRRVVGPCARLLDDAARQWTQLRTLAADAGRRLVVGFGPGLALLPEAGEAVARFRAVHPEVDMQLVEHRNSALVLRELLDGKLDIAVATLRDGDLGDEIEAVPIVELRLHAIVRDDHRLAGRETVALAELADERFAFIDGGDGLSAFAQACAEAGIAPDVAHRCEQLTTLVALLSTGEAITVVLAGPGPAPEPLAARLRALPLAVEQPRATVSVYWSAARPPSVVGHDVVRLAREAALARGAAPIDAR